MSSEFLTATVPFLAIIAVSDGLAFYGAYVALVVRQGLAVPIYRSRALWTAMLAIVFGVSVPFGGNLSLVIPQSYLLAAEFVIYILLYPIATLVIFVWIDRTISTLIRLDFLRRDIAGWKRARYAYWGLVGVSFVFYPYTTGYSYDQFYGLIYTVMFILPLAYAAWAVLAGSRRTTDKTIRSHLVWSGCFIASILVTGAVYFVTLDPVLGSLPYILIGFCAYKMARSLVPVGRLSASPEL